MTKYKYTKENHNCKYEYINIKEFLNKRTIKLELNKEE